MISFIVPAHNEAEELAATLAAMHQAAGAVGRAYEVIVVDDASTDRTAEIARKGGARLLQVDHRQIAATRNSGASSARGDLFIFVDADTRVSTSALRSVLAAVERGVEGGGAAVRYEGWLPLYARLTVPLFVWFYLRVARLAAGCFMFCTRRVFEAVGGFDEELYAAEEVGFCRALKRQGRFCIVREPVLTSGRKFRRYSAWTLLTAPARILVRGRAAVRSRKHLDLWYRDREGPDPSVPSDGAAVDS